MVSGGKTVRLGMSGRVSHDSGTQNTKTTNASRDRAGGPRERPPFERLPSSVQSDLNQRRHNS